MPLHTHSEEKVRLSQEDETFSGQKNQLKDSITELLYISAYNLHRPLVGLFSHAPSARW